MFYFDQKLLATNGANARNFSDQWKHVVNHRNAHGVQQKALAKMFNNGAAVIPRDVYVEFDNTTLSLARANNLTIMNDLMPLAKSLPVGKIEHIYRRASDSGIVTSSISGQIPTELDKAAYDYQSTIKVIHSTGFGRSWMEIEGQRSEAFDGLVDDQANAVRAMQDAIASHIIDGTSDSFNGTDAVGIKNSTHVQSVDLDATDLNVNFATNTTPATIRSKWIAMMDKLRINNNSVGDITFYVSREIMSNFQQFFSTSDVGFGTVLQNLKQIAGVADIKEDASLTGNQVIGIILNNRYIRPLVGMAIATVPLFRANPMDNYNFMTWANVGIEIRSDYNSQKGVLYAREIA